MPELKIYNVTFRGYRLEENASGLPEYSGVYIAYRCLYNHDTDKVTLKELVYIGQAENLRIRIVSHMSTKDLHDGCEDNETICYSYASVSLCDLDVIENALVFAQKPRLNKYLKDHYNYENAAFNIEGTTKLLKYYNFTIKNDE